jgi:hypothetical protein
VIFKVEGVYTTPGEILIGLMVMSGIIILSAIIFGGNKVYMIKASIPYIDTLLLVLIAYKTSTPDKYWYIAAIAVCVVIILTMPLYTSIDDE